MASVTPHIKTFVLDGMDPVFICSRHSIISTYFYLDIGPPSYNELELTKSQEAAGVGEQQVRYVSAPGVPQAFYTHPNLQPQAVQQVRHD